MVVVELVVHLQARAEVAVFHPLHRLVDGLLYALTAVVYLHHLVGAGLHILQRTVQHGRYVETALTIVHVQLVFDARGIVVVGLQFVAHTPAFALWPLRLDAYHSLCRGSIACTRIADDFHIQNLVRRYLLQFLHVVEFTAVDIHLGGSTSEYLHAVVGTLHRRQTLQQVFR